MYSIGVDIGGTKILAGIVSKNGEVLYKRKIPTPELGRDEILILLKEAILKMTEWANTETIPLEKIGIGTAGQVDFIKGVVLSGTTNIKDWGDVFLREEVEKYTHLPIYIDNDVNVLTLAEHQLGAAKGYKEVVCLALGTGVGGGVITNGALLRGAWGGAAELGHMTLDMNGEQCNCGMRGCLETYASGTWVAKRMENLMQLQNPSSGSSLLITSQQTFQLYHEGDLMAKQVVHTMITGLAHGVVNLIHTFNPQIIVLGGGVMENGHWIIELLQKKIHTIGLQSLIKDVKIEISQMSTESGLIGAGMLGE